MKKIQLFIAILLSTTFLQLKAQDEIPKGFVHGKIILSDSTVVTGYIKESIHSNAAVSMITAAGEKKKTYDGSNLVAVEIDSTRYLCIKGDFFRIVCEGELSFLKKESDASRKPVYNGTEALFLNGTEGKINDYFFYNKQQQQLKLLTKKNRAEVVSNSFNNCTAAISKATEAGDDLSRLNQAVDIYNNRNGK